MDALKCWLRGRGPLLVVIVVLAGLLGAGYGQTWFGARAAAPLPGSKGACASPTPGHYTPGPKKGGVTPVVGATPVPREPGVILGMITRPYHIVRTIQAGANHGNKHYVWYRSPKQVVVRTLPHFGFKPPIHLISPPKPVRTHAGRPLRKAVVEYKHDLYRVFVAQPSPVHGPKGIWLIVTIVRQHLVVGQITRPLSVVQRTQKLVNSGKQKFWLYPNAVVKYELPQYGFKPSFDIVTKAKPMPSPAGRPRQHAVIRFKGDLYDIYVVQPGRTGKKGIWMITTISPRP